MLENHASDRAALVAEIEKLRKQLEQTQAERDVLRNELCCLCGNTGRPITGPVMGAGGRRLHNEDSGGL